MSREPEQLKPALQQVQTELKQRLDEACGEHAATESTGELIKLEELLTDAAQAAKQAISIRRRLGADRSRESESEAADTMATSGAIDEAVTTERSEIADARPEGIREFRDQAGALWHVWEVPATQLASRSRPGTYAGEFEEGWLAFECAAGGERRRLPHYPHDWRNLSDADLDALRARAQSATRRPRGPRPESDQPGSSTA